MFKLFRKKKKKKSIIIWSLIACVALSLGGWVTCLVLLIQKNTQHNPDNPFPPPKIDGSNWDGVDSGTIEYEVLDDSKVKYTEASSDFRAHNLSIPDMVYDEADIMYYVVEIGDLCFSEHQLSGGLNIGQFVENIGEKAFAKVNFDGYLNIRDSSLINIGIGAFKQCTFTGGLVAPITLRKIDDFAFEDTVYMDEDLFLGIGIEFIGRGSFVGSKFSRLYLDSHWPFPTFTQWYKNGNPDSDLMLGLGGNDREWESGTVYVDGTRMTW